MYQDEKIREMVHKAVDQADTAKLQMVLDLLEDDEQFTSEEIERIDSLLIEGLESGPSEPMTPEEWADIRKEVRDRAAQRRAG